MDHLPAGSNTSEDLLLITLALSYFLSLLMQLLGDLMFTNYYLYIPRVSIYLFMFPTPLLMGTICGLLGDLGTLLWS